MTNEKKTIAVAVTGASGAAYVARFLQAADVNEIWLTMSPDGLDLLRYELKIKGDLDKFDPAVLNPKSPVKYFHYKDYYCPLGSGSNSCDAYIVLPCTMNTLGKIANGISDNLIVRAADTMLKERKPLILVTRESPYSLIHLENMTRVTRAGGIILPASPGFYHHPKSINDLVDFIVNKLLRQLGLAPILPDWGQ